MKVVSKNPKRSAREKYNRRRRLVAHALGELKFCAEDLLAQPGRIVRRQEIETLLAAIDQFAQGTGLKPPTTEDLYRELFGSDNVE
jgi:hypothetical protein